MGVPVPRVAAIADRLAAELVRLGRWQPAPIDPARLVDMGAFGMNTLAAEEWLQYVLMPRLREVARGESPLPTESSVAAWATRQFDGDPDAEGLLALLRELDALVDGELRDAVAAGDQARVEELLALGTSGHSVGDDGISALHVAAAAGHRSRS